MSIFKDYKIGDRIKVVTSLYGILDGKKGTVTRVFENDSQVEVVLDKNIGKIGDKTILKISNIELDEIVSESSTPTKEEKNNMPIDDGISIDDRLDNLENILNKYGLSVKDSCGFMYVYDFLDELSGKWHEIEDSDKEDIVFCMVGKNSKNVK